jgi:hypothetical protein
MHIRAANEESDRHPPGTIGVYTDHIARFSDFTVSLRGLEVPKGSIFSYSRGVYLAFNTNRFIREMEGEWLFLMDDDHRFEGDILMKLLAHDLDVVVALTSKKFPPYEPVLYRDGKSIDLAGLSGLQEVDACGKPGMLIRKHVLDAMDDPWCEYEDTEEGAEDMDFCYKIRKAGFKIYADLDIQLGHLVPITIYKQPDPNGNWGTMLALGNNGVFLPDSVNG